MKYLRLALASLLLVALACQTDEAATNDDDTGAVPDAAAPDLATPDLTVPEDPGAPAEDVHDAGAPPVDPFEALFDHEVLHHIELRIEPEEWQALLDHMEAYQAVDSLMRTGLYFRATFVYTGSAGDATLEEVGFRTRGNTTRVIPQAPDGTFRRAHFKLDFNRPFDQIEGSAAWEARKDRRWATLRGLNLKWSDEDDVSQIRELYQYDLFVRAGVHAPRTAKIRLTLTIGEQSLDYGVYTAIEPIDKSFLTRRFGKSNNDGNLYKCLWVNEGPATLEPITDEAQVGVKDWETNYRPAYDLKTNEEIADHTVLYDFVDQLAALDGGALDAWLAEAFDVDQFLRYQAMNVLVGMPDDYWAMGNNYYLYFDNGGRAHFFPYDYDHGLGGGWCGDPEWSCEGIAEADIYVWNNLNAAWWDPGTTHPLTDKILARPTFRQQYESYLAAFLEPGEGLFVYADYLARWEALHALLDPHLDNDPGEGEEMTNDPQTQWYFETKTTSVLEQLGLR